MTSSGFGAYAGLLREQKRLTLSSRSLNTPVYGAPKQLGWQRNNVVKSLTSTLCIYLNSDNEMHNFPIQEGDAFYTGMEFDILYEWDDGYRLYSTGDRYIIEQDGHELIFNTIEETKECCQFMKPAELIITEIKERRKGGYRNNSGSKQTPTRSSFFGSKNNKAGKRKGTNTYNPFKR